MRLFDIMQNEKVGIVVVTYNRLKLLQEEIQALRKQTYRDFQIIVVNNGSTDNTADWLKLQGDLIVITQENLGGAGGFFTGMKYVAEDASFTFCWIMDDDVICSANALEELVDAYNKKTDLGFVCSKVIGIDGCPMNTPIIDDRETSNGYADYSDLIAYNMIKVKEATFVSVLFHTKIIHEIGLPYKEFFIWGDDTEYTKRVSLSHDCYMACNSVVIHKRVIQKSLSFVFEKNPDRLKFYKYKIRNDGFVLFKYDSLYQKRRHRVKYYLNSIKYSMMLLIKGELLHAKINLGATLDLIRFKPVVIYPKV